MLNLDTVYCGDCMELIQEIPDSSINLVLTDPPFNIMTKKDIKIKNTKVVRNISFDEPNLNIKDLIKQINRVLVDGGSYYIFCADLQIGEYLKYINYFKLNHKMLLVWYHNSSQPNVRKVCYNSVCQFILFGTKEQKEKITFNFKQHKEMNNVIKISKPSSFEFGTARHGKVGEWCGHPTQKPTKLFRRLIEVSSKEGDVVLDPYVGVGTTPLSAKQLRRHFIGIEISKKYVEIAQKRLSQSVLFPLAEQQEGDTAFLPHLKSVGIPPKIL